MFLIGDFGLLMQSFVHKRCFQAQQRNFSKYLLNLTFAIFDNECSYYKLFQVKKKRKLIDLFL